MTSTGSKGTRQPEADGSVKEVEEDLLGDFLGDFLEDFLEGFLKGVF